MELESSEDLLCDGFQTWTQVIATITEHSRMQWAFPCKHTIDDDMHWMTYGTEPQPVQN
jgi:hypothetical protein